MQLIEEEIRRLVPTVWDTILHLSLEPRQTAPKDNRGMVSACVHISKVADGQILATFTSPPPGTNGRDVCGQPLPFKKNLSNLKDAKNVICAKADVTATIRGNVRLRDGILSVEPLLELHAEQHIGPTQVEFDGDISVKGCLTDAWRLRASGSLISSGVVEAARLSAMGSIHIRGGIIGKDKGLCKAERHIWSRFLSHACVIAGGDVHVKGEIVQSRVTCAGVLKATGGPICGGTLIAGGGIHCKVIGNTSGTPTIIEAGAAQILPATSGVVQAEIYANRKRICGIREKIVPLMKQLKSLTPQQRERCTELLYEADELEEKTNQRDAQLTEESRVISAAARDEIVVSDIIYQGVTLRLSRMETIIQTALKGPFKITSRKEGNSTQIILIEESGKAAHILDSHHIDRSATSTEPGEMEIRASALADA
jgi:uncharacterized protein (DUF342 family)